MASYHITEKMEQVEGGGQLDPARQKIVTELLKEQGKYRSSRKEQAYYSNRKQPYSYQTSYQQPQQNYRQQPQQYYGLSVFQRKTLPILYFKPNLKNPDEINVKMMQLFTKAKAIGTVKTCSSVINK